ncbi:hypothetical protein HETIRDRAFT_238579, partial [Heterobasidion irregulare TC 32-1]
SPPNYESWTKEQLIARLTQLESSQQSKAILHRAAASASAKPPKIFRFAAHPQRKIALRFTYAGWEYNGLSWQDGPTPLPTVERVLFDVLASTRLIDADGGLEGCGWERCGRTDKGVSAAGQVISLWVRKLRYVSMLNRLLPPSIRVLAWSPVAASFSARFNCRFRHYKYFFSGKGLDIDAMREGAVRLVGEHDFRNLCKLDPTKQITNFKRRVRRAEISALAGSTEDLYVFDLVGTAFLYHQVRHIMAVLLLVGTGLERPSLVTALLNVDPEHPYPPFREGEEAPPVVQCKPEYQMTDGLPLMLWECGFADEDLDWRTDTEVDSDETSGEGSKDATQMRLGLANQLESILERSHIHVALDTHFLAAAASIHSSAPSPFPLRPGTRPSGMLNVPLGGGTFYRSGRYVPVVERKRLDSVEIANERWMKGKGGRKEERKRRLAAGGVARADGD